MYFKTKACPGLILQTSEMHTVLSRATDLRKKSCSAVQSQPGVNAHFHFRVKEAAAAIVFPDM